MYKWLKIFITYNNINMPKHQIRSKKILADGTTKYYYYDTSKYPKFYCKTCDKQLFYASKSKHLKSKKHLNLLEVEKLREELKTLHSQLNAPIKIIV